MSKARRSKPTPILIGILLLAGMGGFVVWRAFQPKIKLSSMEEVRAVVPKELLVETPVDPQAKRRFAELIKLIKTLNWADVKVLIDVGAPVSTTEVRKIHSSDPDGSAKQMPATQEFAIARRLWQPNPDLCANIGLLLDAGPIEEPSMTSDKEQYFDASRTIRSFMRAVAICAQLYGIFGDYEHSTKLTLTALKLSDRLFLSSRSILGYLEDASMEAITTAAIQRIASRPDYPLRDCQLLLKAMGASPKRDETLKLDLRSEFQRYTLKSLVEDPQGMYQGITEMDASDGEPQPFVGTYDAVETAHMYGKAILAAMSNVTKPFSEYDSSEDERLDRISKGIPTVPDTGKSKGIILWWERVNYRIQMNNTHNSIGRTIFCAQFSAENSMGLSCRWRAMRDATRVLLASRIYRAGHGGHLPADTSGFLPLLGEWPQDPYNGKPMIYLPKQEKVYSVGENLVDDGGDVGPIAFSQKDIGVSLAR